MKPKEIQELIDFISKSGLDEVNIETESFKIKVKKNSEPKGSAQVVQVPAPVAQVAAAAPVQVAAPAAAPAATTPAAPATNENLVEIKSPMIGTFYRAANPEAPNFAKVGDTITAGQTVCIVEAMKLFNEIESEISGTIVKVLIENSTPVEYDQPLFLVDTSA